MKNDKHVHSQVIVKQVATGRRLSNGKQQLITRLRCTVCNEVSEWTTSTTGKMRRYYR